MREPLVSVVIPAHNVERYIGAAIDSVLAQRHRPLEVIVVDDGSSDATRTIVESFGPPVRYLRQAHAGAPAARNHGVALARGECLAFLDGDDLWSAAKLELQLHALASTPAPDLVTGHVRKFISPELPGAQRARLRCPSRPLRGQVPGVMLIRRAAFDKVGGFDEALPAGEYLDWLSRARRCGLRELMLTDCVLSRRLHATNYMREHPELVYGYPALLKAALDRRRAGGKVA